LVPVEIADASYEFQRRLDAGKFVLVGVNVTRTATGFAPSTLYVDPRVEERQLARLAT